jgi:mono/diheme cytochrome c family protein
MQRLLAALTLLALSLPARAAPVDAKGLEFFETKIRPVFVEHCASCHSAKDKKVRGKLSLDNRAAMLAGGENGPALVPGKPDASLLMKAVRHQGELKMPEKGKLPEKVLADLAAWIRMGAPAPEGDALVLATIDLTKGRQFWSFQAVRRPGIPAVRADAWAKNPIDRFILARLEGANLAPTSQAERRTLLRRVTFDLIGLPPTPEEVEAFVGDTRPDAYERVVGRLLASPAHGERWARHWLDVARYAEDQAHTFGVRPNTQAWRYRDWVIDALNGDMPYDGFVKLQIAADLMGDVAGDLAALGYFGLGAEYYKDSADSAVRAKADELDDRVDTLSRGFLGLTVACARCHDHKFDPIPTMDYYSLAGVFDSSSIGNVFLAPREQVERFQKAERKSKESGDRLKGFVQGERRKRAEAHVGKLADHLVAAWKVRAGQRDAAKGAGLDPALVGRLVDLLKPNDKVGKNVAALAPLRKSGKPAEVPVEVTQAAKGLQAKMTEKGSKGDKALTQALLGDNGALLPKENDLPKLLSKEENAKWSALRQEAYEAGRSTPPAPPVAHGMSDRTGADMKVNIRGNPATQGAVAPRRFLRLLAGDEPAKFTKGSGRLELAEAIASKDNPLTARVLVNRLWMHHFGRGLVGTPSNFGLLGDRPLHPELLDWLASELVESGWSLKHVHRLIVTSATYQQASLARTETAAKDPDNRLYGRANRRRLEVEAWRDSLLAVSGELNRNLGGPTFNLEQMGTPRRTVYARISRHDLNPLLRLFDFPDANITAEKRTETTVPQQQLFVMNSAFFLDRAKALSARLTAEPDDASRIRLAYKLTLGRSPDDAELRLGRLYLSIADDPDETKQNRLSRAARYAQVLMAGNEFLYVD